MADAKADERVPIPPLYRPEIEILVEQLELPDANGNAVEVTFRASPNEREVKIGGVTVELQRGLKATGDTKDEAIQELCKLVGIAVAQAYADLLQSDDPEKREAARSMEIGSR